MKYYYLFVAILLAVWSCKSDDEAKEVFIPGTYTVSGNVEKGPFVSGTTVTIQPLDDRLEMLGSMYTSTIDNYLGHFSFGAKQFDTPYVELTANGYFFNEVKGEFSSGPLTLRALVDITDRNTVNVNLLTHLKYYRVKNLVAKGMSFKDANNQAQTELLTAFGLQRFAKTDVSAVTITGESEQSGALMAVSSLLLMDRNEAELTEYLARLGKEFGENGKFSDTSISQINNDKLTLRERVDGIRENMSDYFEHLGVNVYVMGITPYIDWDNDGVAGNETLASGQKVVAEPSELIVPNDGGTYTITIISPIPVYLEPHYTESIIGPDIDTYFKNLYETSDGDAISMETSLTGNKLTIKVEPLNSSTKTAVVNLYDGLGNVVCGITVTQSGNGTSSIPKLGDHGKKLVAGIAQDFAKAFCEMNIVEQYYNFNKETKQLSDHISPYSNVVYNLWSDFYSANSFLLAFKRADAEQLGVYQDYFNVFGAIIYYHMVVAWGDVPYINRIMGIDEYVDVCRTPQATIFADLKANLETAISNFDEKKNVSLGGDMNDFFFISNDVARILLADICMYEGNYGNAKVLLEKVIGNGFYSLDASNYNKIETIDDLLANGNSGETILAFYNNRNVRSNISFTAPRVVPLMTYTDVILSYAECLYKDGNAAEAERQLMKVAAAKGIDVEDGDVLDKICDARLQLMLYTNTNFAFMKRNGFATSVYGIEGYRALLPIPASELNAYSKITQNPGY